MCIRDRYQRRVRGILLPPTCRSRSRPSRTMPPSRLSQQTARLSEALSEHTAVSHDQEYPSHESFSTCYALHGVLLVLNLATTGVSGVMVSTAGSSGALYGCTCVFGLCTMVEAISCADLCFRGKIRECGWHGSAYKRVVACLVLETAGFFVCVVTFVFHSNGLSFWSCIVQPCVSNSVQAWVTARVDESSVTSRTLHQQLVWLRLDFDDQDKATFWGVLFVWLCCSAAALKVLHLRSGAQGTGLAQALALTPCTCWLCILAAAVTGLSGVILYALVHTGDSKHLGPLIVTVLCLLPILSYTRVVWGGRERRTRWHVRMVTLKGLALLVVLTYAALVCLVFLVTNELPSLADLDWEHKLELYTLVSVHCALALLTSATVWVHLGLRTHTAAGVSNLDGPGMASPILTATPLDRRRHEYVHEHHCHDSPGPGDQAEYYDLSLIHISEPTRLLSISYAVFCLKKKKKKILKTI
eukprot:TRINITY_DN11210_c0_g1_i6.p1 TRINITY_DN11210_c0_g1~~TRINITY_DN11210_c0_g1_i6.p1  ORF type:complete len:471 (-),score=102.37 TRINITY_DN11210_c0_g1_i6:84-1496(-)